MGGSQMLRFSRRRDGWPILLIATVALGACGIHTDALKRGADATPPLQPDGELPISHPQEEDVARCFTALQPILRPRHQQVDRYVVSFNSSFGPVLRADISSGDTPPVRTRFVCPLRTNAKPGPIVIAVEPKVPALASGTWGQLAAGGRLDR